MALWLFLVAAFSWALLKILRIGRREASLPPGPPTLSLLGNLHLFPKEYPYLKFTEWAQQYGGIFSLKLGPSNIVVLTDTEAVKDLLDKQSAYTSDRPASHFSDVVAGGMNLALARYERAMILRKRIHMVLSPEISNRHIPIQTAETIQLTFDLLKSPEKAYMHIGRWSNSIIMSVAFGKRCPRYETEHSRLFFEMEHAWESLNEIGAHPPVDLIPILRYVPERWAPWKTLCRRVRSMQRDLYLGLLEECEDRLCRGVGNGCYMEDIIKKKEELGMDREMVAYLGGVMIEAGSETTTSFLRSLILAFIEYPETQRKAQEEIDRVIGDDHAPMLEDFGHLPYIQALIKEMHRFRPSAPLAIPHANLVDVEYKGYIIPKDTAIFLNVWGIFHDPSLFHQPEVFNPDRYLLTEHGTVPGANDQHFRSNLVFGAGRRICPGLTLANNSLMLSLMYLIWAFDFSDSVDMTTGKPFSTDIHNFTKGVAITSNPFKCRINPRSKLRADIIEHQFVDTIDTFVKFEDRLDEGERAWLAATREKLL